LNVTPTKQGANTFAVFADTDYLPSYYEMTTSVTLAKPASGYGSNAYLIFDYVSATDFKFAGINAVTGNIEIGHISGTTWVVDASKAAGITTGKTAYTLLLAVNGSTATLTVNSTTSASFTFAARLVQGTTVGLNYGINGLATNNATASYGDTAVQIVVNPMTARYTETFATNPRYFDTVAAGTWALSSQGYTGTAPSNGVAVVNIDLGLALGQPAGAFRLQDGSTLEVTAILKQVWPRGGLVYDMSGTGSFKFAALYVDTQQVVLGHYTTAGGWVIDAVTGYGLNSGKSYTLDLLIDNGTVNLSVGGALVLTYTYGSELTAGTFGLLAVNGTASFQSVATQTNDPAFSLTASGVATALEVAAGPAPTNAGGTPLTDAQLAPIVAEAEQLWVAALGPTDARLNALKSVTVEVGDLMGLTIGVTQGDTIIIDPTAAGWGWFVDPTPGSNSEFATKLSSTALLATSSSPAFGHMDLLTTVLHEMGNVMGFREDLGQDVTGMMLSPGERLLPSSVLSGTTTTTSPSHGKGGTDAPVIHWSNPASHGRTRDLLSTEEITPSWMIDFVSNLGQDDSTHKLNASIRVRLPGGSR
jgi:hypothetical protein